MFITMYETKVTSIMNDQLSPRRSVRRQATKMTPANPILCLWIGVPDFMFFLNFIENIGISLMRR